MKARNKEYEGDRRCAYAVHIYNNTITKESQSLIREVLARSCWRAGPGQEASDGSKVRREGKARPFIPCEVRAQTGSERATMPAVARRRRWATIAVDAWVKAYPLRRQRLCPGENLSVRAATHAPGQHRLRPGDDVCYVGGVVFHKLLTVTPNFGARATMSTFGRQRLRTGDNVCVRATTSAHGGRRLAHAFMSRARFARPNCEYDKKDFLKKLQWRKF